MDRKILQQAEQYGYRRKRRKFWKKVVTLLSSIVVFATTYMLILPAITMEPDALCGMEEHIHNESCYEKVANEQDLKLLCTEESLGVHVHSAECYNAEGSLNCSEQDCVVHTHNELCMNADGKLICLLPAAMQHSHTDACYVVQGVHVHEDAC